MFGGARRRRWFVLPVSATAAALMAASAAWACAPGMGSHTTVSPGSCHKPCTVKASAMGAASHNKAYNLAFADHKKLAMAGAACAKNGIKIGGPTQSTNTGTIALTTGHIPATAAVGSAQVCFVNPANKTDATAPAAFSVL